MTDKKEKVIEFIKKYSPSVMDFFVNLVNDIESDPDSMKDKIYITSSVVSSFYSQIMLAIFISCSDPQKSFENCFYSVTSQMQSKIKEEMEKKKNAAH